MKERSTTNTLLLIMVIPLVFYLLKILSFIFVPLFFSMFISLLFLPLMRWLQKKNVPKTISLSSIIALIFLLSYLSGKLISISTSEILSVDSDFYGLAEVKLSGLIASAEEYMGVHRLAGEGFFTHYLGRINLVENLLPTFGIVSRTLTMTLMTAFFVILFLAGSINFQEVMHTVLFKQRFSSIKTFRKIEKDIIKFILVKFFISLFTGVGFTLACLAFDVSFPVFWGLFAFLINFVQMVGSVISVILLGLFGIVELDPTATWVVFIIVIIGVQVVMGSILEPIFLGKTFSINVITVLVMLMLWGFIWGVPGLIMAIPLTVFVKIILEQFPNTKVIAKLMSGDHAMPRKV